MTRSILAQHLDAAYGLALAASGDPRAAETATAAAFEAAAVATAHAEDGYDPRALLFGHVLHQVGLGVSHVPDKPAPATEQARLLLGRAVPAAFQALGPEDRQLLWLCGVSGLDEEAAVGLVVGPETTSDAEERHTGPAAAIVDRARGRFVEHVLQAVAPTERLVLLDGLPDEWVEAALRDHLRPAVPAAPDTLRRTVAAVYGPGRVAGSPGGRRRPVRGPVRPSGSIRWTAPIVLIAVIALIVVYSRWTGAEPGRATQPTLLDTIVQAVEQVRPRVQTDDAGVAAAFVAEHLGQQVRLPGVRNGQLEGLTVIQVQHAALPVLVFRDDEGRRSLIILTTYGALDRLEGSGLDNDLLRGIADTDAPLVHLHDGRPILIWRQRAAVGFGAGAAFAGDSPESALRYDD